MGQRLKGKVAIVTGASRGMGLEISRLFASEGAQVAMLARSPEELKSASADIQGTHPFACDVADPAAVATTFAAIDRRFGRIDILINNAGLARPRLIEEADDNELALQVGANLLGPVHCMRAAIPAMRRNGIGDIVNISSESVTTPYPFLLFYAATKAALEAITTGLRSELKGSGIRASLYRSGRVISSFNEAWDPTMLDQVKAMAASSGFNDQSGGRIEATIPAQAMLDLVLLDRSAHIEMIQLRGA